MKEKKISRRERCGRRGNKRRYRAENVVDAEEIKEDIAQRTLRTLRKKIVIMEEENF